MENGNVMRRQPIFEVIHIVDNAIGNGDNRRFAGRRKVETEMQAFARAIPITPKVISAARVAELLSNQPCIGSGWQFEWQRVRRRVILSRSRGGSWHLFSQQQSGNKDCSPNL